MTKGTIKSNQPENKNSRSIDSYFNRYSACYQTAAAKLTTAIFISLMMFGLLGLAWAIPFPYLKFLGKYNGFFNWASFFIALCVYGYYKLSPVLSYFVFFILFVFSYAVMQLDLSHKSGGPALWLICALIFVASFSIQFASYRMEFKRSSLTGYLQFLAVAPVWLLHFILKRFKIRY